MFTPFSVQEKSLTRRPRRNRQSAAIRSLVRETQLCPSQLIAPLFVVEGEDQRQPIASMPGVYRYSLDHILREVTALYHAGVRAVDLFTLVPTEKKDPCATEAIRRGNLLQQAIETIKNYQPELCVMVDIALDPFTDHGHDGIVDETGQVLNDATVEVLCEMSLLCAEAGCDFVAPSDMMDGRVAAIPHTLDQANFTNVGILSYTAKYASCFYGPFRDALQSKPQFGDKKTYQMDPANSREALLEATLDTQEGADILLVKPALPYLDIISKLRKQTELPIAAYHVSGEYAMVMAAAEKGWLDKDAAFLESLTAIRRAGADMILTYAALPVARQL